jgi:hypothetical protein
VQDEPTTTTSVDNSVPTSITKPTETTKPELITTVPDSVPVDDPLISVEPEVTAAPTEENESVADLEEINTMIEDLAELDPATVTAEQLDEVLSSDLLDELSDEQVVAIVDVLVEVIDNLSDQELAVLADTLSAAPDNVKDEFEAQVDVFSGKFDGYVPAGSVVSVGKRRVLNAVIATVMVVPAAAGTGSSSRRR